MLVHEHVYKVTHFLVLDMVNILHPFLLHLYSTVHAGTWACLDGPVLGIGHGVHAASAVLSTADSQSSSYKQENMSFI